MRGRILLILAMLLLLSACGNGEPPIQTVPEITVSRETLQLQEKLAKWYNINLLSENPDVGFERAYNSILSFEDGIIGYVELPGVEVYPIYHEMRSNGFCLERYSAFPVGGKGNRTRLTMTQSLPLRMGGSLRIHVLGKVFTYRIGEAGEEQVILYCGRDVYSAGRMVED